MDAAAPVVLVGGGHAAAAFVNSVRRAGFEGPLVLISEEPALPYHRPPLSKKYLADAVPLEQILIRPAAWYEEQRVGLRLGTRVQRIDCAARNVELSDGTTLAYGTLVLTTGARPRRLPAAIGGDLSGVLVMRSLADADAMAPHLVAGRRLVVIGGGYIGLEAAAVAATKGMKVTLLEAAPRILQRVAAPATADFFRSLHRGRGVEVCEGVAPRRLLAQGLGGVGGAHVCGVELADGRVVDADAVLVGIGVDPDVELARAAGLAIDNGIGVDEFCRTSDPHILAAGDCCSFPYRGARLRLESVQNANDQAAVAAHTVAGKPAAYAALPWFWSDQYDTKLQIAGLNQGYDDAVARAGKTERSLSVWYFRGESLLAVDAINDAAAFVVAKKLLERGASVPKASVRDPASEFKSWLA